MDEEQSRQLNALAERRVSRVGVDNHFRLNFFSQPWDDPPTETIEVVIGTRFRYRIGPGPEFQGDPQDNRAKLGPALGLFDNVISAASVSSSGQLTLDFKDGSRVVVPPDSGYEAWEMSGPGSALLVCPPGGGEPAEWSDRRSS